MSPSGERPWPLFKIKLRKVEKVYVGDKELAFQVTRVGARRELFGHTADRWRMQEASMPIVLRQEREICEKRRK